jgi:hypothetical protein
LTDIAVESFDDASREIDRLFCTDRRQHFRPVVTGASIEYRKAEPGLGADLLNHAGRFARHGKGNRCKDGFGKPTAIRAAARVSSSMHKSPVLWICIYRFAGVPE